MSLAAHNLSLDLGGARLLDGIELTLEPGQIAALIGPNGAGKSSLLRTLSSEWAPSSGEAVLNGRPVSAWRAAERAAILALLPQHSSLNFAFTGEEVVLLGRTPHASGRQRDREITHAALALVDGTALGRRIYTQLSGGEKQRIQLARVLAQVWEPVPFGARFLLLDEPTSSFDLAHQRMMLEILRQFADDGVGLAVVLHDLNFAARVADTMIMLNAGRIAATGTPAEIMQADVIAAVFGVEVSIVRHPLAGTPMAIL